MAKRKIIKETIDRLKSEFYDVDNEYLRQYSNEIRYEFSSNGRMKKAKRRSFAWVVKNTLNEIKTDFKKYTDGNPTMTFEDLNISLNGELVDECFKKYCDESFNN